MATFIIRELWTVTTYSNYTFNKIIQWRPYQIFVYKRHFSKNLQITFNYSSRITEELAILPKSNYKDSNALVLSGYN